MTGNPRLIVFSDLDGTLLHHDGYSWRSAEPALVRLREEKAGLVLATSKTTSEVAPLRAEIGFTDWPAIVENGGGLLAPEEDTTQDISVYDDLRDALRRLPSGFVGFGDMTAQEIARRTGLSRGNAEKAKMRQFSEPGIWTGADDQLDGFVAAAQAAGLVVQRGGRFITLSFGGTKADRMDEVIKRFAPEYTIALGDAPNDIEMIQCADFGVIVANSASPGVPRLPGEKTRRIRRTTQEGPDGWAEAVFEILDQISTTREPTIHG